MKFLDRTMTSWTEAEINGWKDDFADSEAK